MEASERYTGRAADPRGRSTGTYTGTHSGSGVTATGGDKRWLLLGVIALAQLMIVLDATIMNIALPSAQKDLGFSVVARQWVVTAYALAFGSLLLFGGKLGALVGRKVTFVTGLIGFWVDIVIPFDGCGRITDRFCAASVYRSCGAGKVL